MAAAVHLDEKQLSNFPTDGFAEHEQVATEITTGIKNTSRNVQVFFEE